MRSKSTCPSFEESSCSEAVGILREIRCKFSYSLECSGAECGAVDVCVAARGKNERKLKEERIFHESHNSVQNNKLQQISS
jgi:hypothetical protein